MTHNSSHVVKIIGASLLFLMTTACGKQSEQAQAPPPAVAVEIKDLNDETVRSSSEFVGSLEAKQRVALAPRVDGRVLEIAVQEGDTVEFADRKAQVFFVPGHTRAHIAYYFSPTTPETTGELFCGDTIFAGGCGRLFEGTPAQMVDSIDKLRQLPDNTRVWCAHEYTLNNLKFALTVDKDNSQLQTRYQEVKQARNQGIPTVPSLLGVEKQTNPFLRWDTPGLQATAKIKEPARVFGRIRGMKDKF